MSKIKNRKSISVEEKDYSYISSENNNNFIKVTEWTNGEGFDITLNERIICLHRDQIDVINAMIWALDHDFNLEKNERH